MIDNKQAGFDATDHLLKQGCRQIMFIGDNLSSNVYAERQQGYMQALSFHRMPVDPELTYVTNLGENSGEQVLHRLRELPVTPVSYTHLTLPTN